MTKIPIEAGPRNYETAITQEPRLIELPKAVVQIPGVDAQIVLELGIFSDKPQFSRAIPGEFDRTICLSLIHTDGVPYMHDPDDQDSTIEWTLSADISPDKSRSPFFFTSGVVRGWCTDILRINDEVTIGKVVQIVIDWCRKNSSEILDLMATEIE